MRPIVIICIWMLCGAPRLQAQQPAHMLWARGHSSTDGYSSLIFSPHTGLLLATSAEGWQSWPIGLISLPLNSPDSFIGGSPYCSVLTKDGQEVLSGMGTGAIWAWSPATNRLSFITNPSSGASSVQWLDATADGNLIAACGAEDGILHVYDRSASRDIITWTKSIGSVSFSPDGKLLLAGSNNSLVLIDVAKQSIIHRYSNIVNNPMPVAFDPGRPGIFVVQDNNFWVMDTSGRVLAKLTVGTTSYNNSIAFSPSGKTLAVVGGGIALVDMDSYKVHGLPFSGGSVTFVSEDTIAFDNAANIILYSISKSALLGALTTPESYSIAFLPDGSALLNGWNPCDIRRGQLQSSELFPNGYPTRSVLPNSYSLHGSMAAGTENYPGQGIYVWQDRSDSGTLLSMMPDSICAAMSVFSPDSSVIAFALHLGCHDADPYRPGYTTLELWGSREQKRLYRLNAPILPANAIVFSQDGSLLATSDGDSCFVWNISSGNLVGQFRSHSPNPWGVEVMSFLPGDTSILLRGYEVRSLSGSVLRYMPSSNRAQILRLPDGRYVGGAGDASNLFFLSPTADQWPDSNVDFFDLEQGKVTNTVTVLEKYCEGSMVVNPATGDFAMGGRDLIYYKSPEPLRSNVQLSPLASAPLEAYAQNGHIEVSPPSEHGRVYVYRSDGRCFYSSQTQAGTVKYTTGPLPAGVYFVVFQSEIGERRFAKVSLLE